MGQLQDKVAIITGSGSGMGKATANLFAMEGAKVVATDIREDAVQDVVGQLSSIGEIIALKHNVTNEDDWAKVVNKTIETYGKIDILVNNAGMVGSGAGAELSSMEEWQMVIDVNLKSAFLGTRYVVPKMRNNGGGSIVNISSVAGLVGLALANAYTASKGGLIAFTKASAIEFGKDNIRVNCICPGNTATPMSHDFLQGDLLQQILNATPLRRLGQPQDIAHAVLYLASNVSDFLTGVILPVDGGWVAQ